MSRRDDAKGYIQIDPAGRITVLGSGLRRELTSLAGYYTHLPSDGALLHFQRAQNHPTYDEFRDPIILQGDIAAMGSTIEVINFVSSSQMSGNLIFVAGELRKCLYFKNGEVRGAHSNRVEDRLGEIMYRQGGLSRAELDTALEECRRRRRPLGNLLLETGRINQAELYVFVRKQVEEIFYSILLCMEGDFYLTRFDTEKLPSPLSLNAQSLLMEGLRRMDEMSYFKQKIPDVGTSIARGRKDPSGVALEPREQLVLETLTRPMTVEEVARTVRIGEFDAMKVVFHLVKAGFLRVVEDQEAAEGLDSEKVTAEMSDMVDTFNSVFQRIYQAISRHGRQDALEQGLETFLQFYGFVELFKDVTFDNHGRLDKERLLTNLRNNQIDNRVSFLSQALNELLFFEMFAAREWLEREEQQDLQRVINQLFIEIG